MIPSLFIQNPKTAGLSMRLALLPFGLHVINPLDLDEVAAFQHNAPLVSFAHASVGAVRDAGIITQEWIDDRWSFGFLRNPWDRTVAVYNYLLRVRKPHFLAKYGIVSFADFAGRLEGKIDPIGLFNWRGLSQANPQSVWLAHCDFIGRFEHLDRDWQLVCVKLGVDAALSHVNEFPHPPYQEYYTVRLRDQIGRIFSRDVELGEYEFSA